MQITDTERLVLRELVETDAPFIRALVNSPGWLKFIGDRGIKTIADAENYIIKGPVASYENNGFGLYLVALKEEDVSIGMCGLIQRDSLPGPDIGFAFLPEYTGHGYALEAATAILRHAHDKLQLEKLLAITMEENIRSVQLLGKLGFRFEKKVQLGLGEKELMLFGTP